MEIESKQFGNQQIDPESIIKFPNGIPGFENQKRYQLLHQEDSKIVYLLQSLDIGEVAFSVALPIHFNINYQFLLTDEEQQILQLDSLDDLLILLILHREESPDKSALPTIKGSIKSPLLINVSKRIGLQKLLAEVEQSITLTEKTKEINVSET